MVRMVCGTNEVTAGLSGTDDDDADVRDDESRSLSLKHKTKIEDRTIMHMQHYLCSYITAS